MMKEYVSQEPNVHILGRTTVSDGLINLFWTARGMELDIASSQLLVEFISDYTTLDQWISIEINGCVVSRLMVAKGKQKLCIFRNMDPNRKKHVRILKDSQAPVGDERAILQIGRMEYDGTIFKMEPRPWKLEFVGDSITSGEGAIGAVVEEDWVPMYFSAFHNYAVMTADELKADFRIVSQSGWGVLSSWDNNPRCALPDYYESVCGVLSGQQSKQLGANEPYDFCCWQPDAVIINLGTNDDSAFHQPEWTDGKKGFKQRLNTDGSYVMEDVERFQNKADAFLKKVRANNLRAQIVWAVGMMKRDLLPYIKSVVDQSGDGRISFLQLPEVTQDTMGARQHPGAANHREAAKALSGYLTKLVANGTKRL
jgi:hypothetical protein